jgi:hypothetical protein
VYLIRSLGTIYGVTITSAIVQNVLVARLPEALRGIENSEQVGSIRGPVWLVANTFQVIDDIRRSIFALRGLSPHVQHLARMVYYDAIKLAFLASSGFAMCALIASLFANGRSLRKETIEEVVAEYCDEEAWFRNGVLNYSLHKWSLKRVTVSFRKECWKKTDRKLWWI